LAGEVAKTWGPYLTRNLRCPPYTASVDAAIAISKHALADWFIHSMSFETIAISRGEAANGWIVDLTKGFDAPVVGKSKSLPIAICLATLRAKLEEPTA
jgi:hypothetical protein